MKRQIQTNVAVVTFGAARKLDTSLELIFMLLATKFWTLPTYRELDRKVILWILTSKPIRLAEDAFNRSLKIRIKRLYKPVFVERKVMGSCRMNVGTRTRQC